MSVISPPPDEGEIWKGGRAPEELRVKLCECHRTDNIRLRPRTRELHPTHHKRCGEAVLWQYQLRPQQGAGVH